MKKIVCLFMGILFMISLTGCSPTFNGSRMGNDRQFIMKYSAFNTTDSQDLYVESGDKINASIVVDGGQLSIKIQKGNEKPIYEDKKITASNDFDIDIEESGTYTVSVIGKKAKGSVSFVVENN